jgi:hypothetical protein
LAGHIACKGKARKAYGTLVQKPQTKKPLGKPKIRRNDIIKWIFNGDMDEFQLAQNCEQLWDFENSMTNLCVP